MLPDDWVKRIFARLTVRYGVAFSRQWDGVDPALVMADWAEHLSGLTADNIAHGLNHLPADRPPTVGHFRDCCRRAPEAPVVALPAPKADPEYVRTLVAKLAPPRAGNDWGNRGWAQTLKARDECGDRLTLFQRACYREVLREQ